MFIKSKKDYRKYKYIKLPNNIEFVFIKDKNADESAVSLIIDSGTYNDEIYGTAHFLEHMIFMGNTKYPDEHYFSNFINSRNGDFNAYTAGDHTCYHYSINHNYLLESLDIFSNFFISPLFNEDAIYREINAVDSEHNKNILNDNWRIMQMIRYMCPESSPFRKFSCGNSESLNIPNIREYVIEYYNKYYYASNMKLVVLYNSTKSKNIIKKISSMFSQIKDKICEKINYPKNNLIKNTNFNVVPINNENKLFFVFEINKNDQINNNNLLNFIQYILSNESKNSLFDYLRNLGLVQNILVETDFDTHDTCFLVVQFLLSDDNNKSNINKVICAYNKFIDTILDSNSLDTILDEYKFILNQQFNDFEIFSPADYVTHLSRKLLETINKKYILYHDYSVGEFISKNKFIKLFKNITKQLKINKESNIIHASPEYNENKKLLTEKWFGIKYIETDINYDRKLNIDFDFELPKENKYISPKKSIIKNITSDNLPKKIIDENNISIYQKKNIKFNSIDCIINIFIFKNDIYSSIENYVKYKFFIKLISFIYKSDFYDIMRSNNNIQSKVHKEFIKISYIGYYKNCVDILEDIIKKIQNIKISKSHFNLIKQELLNNLNNKKFDSPITKTFNCEKENILNLYSNKEIIECLEKYNNIDDLMNIRFFDYNKIIVYTEGNINTKTSSDIYDMLRRYYVIDDTRINKTNINKNQRLYNKNILSIDNDNSDENNNFTLYRVYFGKLYESDNWMKKLCCNKILDLIIQREFFNSLRTKEQLGYIVKCKDEIYGKINDKYMSYVFFVQSYTHSCDYLEKRIRKFIKYEIDECIEKLNKDDFEEIKSSVINKLKQPFNDIYESSDFYVDKIINDNFMYSLNKELIKCLKNIKKSDIMRFYKKYINTKNYHCFKLVASKN